MIALLRGRRSAEANMLTFSPVFPRPPKNATYLLLASVLTNLCDGMGLGLRVRGVRSEFQQLSARFEPEAPTRYSHECRCTVRAQKATPARFFSHKTQTQASD